MLRLPIFLIFLLVLSSAAGFPVESKLQRDLTQESPKDFGMRAKRQNPWIECNKKTCKWRGTRKYD
nr:conotoxin T M12 [Conus magus]